MPPPQNDSPRIGSYTLHNVLGRGANSVVWRATDSSTGLEVALKLEQYLAGAAELAPDFEAAVAAVAALEHEGLAKVFAGGLTNHPDGKSAPGLYVAMELFAEGTAADLLMHGPVDPRRSAELVRDVCKAVTAAYRRGVLHLDIRPANIFLDGQRPKLADFGTLRPAPIDNIGILSRAMGIIGFAAPEQAHGRKEDIDHRTDVYGLCATLSALVTGSALGDDEKLAELRASWPELVAILDRGLEPEPERRYRSATALGLALDEILGSEDIEASALIEEQSPPWVVIGVLAVTILMVVLRFTVMKSDPSKPQVPNASGQDSSAGTSAPRVPTTSGSTGAQTASPQRQFDLPATESKLSKGDYAGAAADFATVPPSERAAFTPAEKSAWVRVQVGQWLYEHSYHPADERALESFMKGGSLGRDIADLIRTAQSDPGSMPYELEVLGLLSDVHQASSAKSASSDSGLADELSSSLRKHPGRAELVLTAAMYELSAGNPSLAREQLRNLPRNTKQPGRLLLRLLSDLALQEKAVTPDSFDGLVQRFPVLEADLGLAYLLREDNGDLPRALDALSNVTESYPDMAAGFHNLAAAQTRAGDLDGALETLRTLVESAPEGGGWDQSWSSGREFEPQDRVSASYVAKSTGKLLGDPWLAPLREAPGWDALELP